MFKRNLYLVTYKNASGSCTHVYGGTMSEATENFWKYADRHLVIPGVHLDIIEIKLVGTVLVQLAPGI